MKQSLRLEEAQDLLLNLTTPGRESLVSLPQATGLVLSQDIRAAENVPAFDKSPLDGYALKACDTKNADSSHPVRIKVIEEIRAGFMPAKQVTGGTTIKIMTGAPLPQGADVVVKFEDVRRSGDYIEVFKPLKSGSNIIIAGEDLVQGELVACQNTVITPALVGLLASIGIDQVPVFLPPRIAIISTGDELLDPSEKLRPGKIFNSSLYSLQAQCQALGAEPVVLGIVPDDTEAVAERIQQGLQEADLVITTGGVSVGDYDVVQDALTRIGAEIIFWKLAMKPGSPLLAARKGEQMIICLSGNPAAALVTFDLVAVPVIKKLMGLRVCLPPRIEAILMESFSKSSPQRRFLRARLYRSNGVDFARLTGDQGNGVLKSMLGCNLLLDVPAGSGPVLAGQKLGAYVVADLNQSFQEENWSQLRQLV